MVTDDISPNDLVLNLSRDEINQRIDEQENKLDEAKAEMRYLWIHKTLSGRQQKFHRALQRARAARLSLEFYRLQLD